jgi:hypothetical protein
MEGRVWATGTLLVSGPGPVKVGIGQTGIEVYNDPGAWTPSTR